MSASSPAPDWLSLESDERVWLQASPSGNLVLASLTLGFIILTAAAIIGGLLTDLTTGRRITFGVLVFVLGLFAAAAVVITRHEYVLTNQRICTARGLWHPHVSAVPLDDVQDVTVIQSGWQHPLNVGTIRFHTPAEAAPVEFAFVDDPAYLYQRILALVDGDTLEGADATQDSAHD